MPNPVNRRTFTKAVLAGLGATAVSGLPAESVSVPARAQTGTAKQLDYAKVGSRASSSATPMVCRKSNRPCGITMPTR